MEVARKLFDDVCCVTMSFFFYLCFSYFSCPWPRNFPFQRDLLFECRDSKHREYWQCMLYYENCWRGNSHTWKYWNSSFWENWERWFLLILTDYCEDALQTYLWAYEWPLWCLYRCTRIDIMLCICAAERQTYILW